MSCTNKISELKKNELDAVCGGGVLSFTTNVMICFFSYTFGAAVSASGSIVGGVIVGAVVGVVSESAAKYINFIENKHCIGVWVVPALIGAVFGVYVRNEMLLAIPDAKVAH